jgi:hypothetical protein
MAINSAPINEPKESQVWTRWFADLGDSLEGDWVLYTKELTNTGSGAQVVNIQNLGKCAQIQIKISSATSGMITLPFRAKETILRVWDIDSQTLIGGALVDGKIIQLPTLSGENILIEGMVIKWTR